MGPFSLCYSARGDFVSISPVSILAGVGRGLVSSCSFHIVSYIGYIHSLSLPYTVGIQTLVGLCCNIGGLLILCILTVRILWESTACQDYFHYGLLLALAPLVLVGFSYYSIPHIYTFDSFLLFLQQIKITCKLTVDRALTGLTANISSIFFSSAD